MSQIEIGAVNNKATNHDRFIRIAERRVNKVIDSLDNLGKCSDRRNYEYNEYEVRKIFREIEGKVREVKLQFQGKNNSKSRFKLWNINYY